MSTLARPLAPTATPRLTQADVDRTLRQVHRAGDASATDDGPLVSIRAATESRTLTTRLLLPQARRLREQLDAAIARAEADQDRRDETYRDNGWEREVAG